MIGRFVGNHSLIRARCYYWLDFILAPSDWSVGVDSKEEVLMHRSLTKELRKSINNVLGSSLTTMEEA